MTARQQRRATTRWRDPRPQPSNTSTKEPIAGEMIQWKVVARGDGNTCYHHEEACAVTAQYANLATNTWATGNLLLAAEAVELKDEELSAYKDLYNRMDHQMAIRTKYPFKQSSRKNIRMSAEDFREVLVEIVEGVLRDHNEEVPASIPTYTLKHGGFSNEDRKRIMRLIRQII
ncbi:hypothetical protein BST61_g5050 [Cercospora zeina]